MNWISDTKLLLSLYPKKQLRESVTAHGLDSILSLIDEYAEAFHDYADNVGFSYAVETLEEAYAGHYRDLTDYAVYLFDEGVFGEVSPFLAQHIDFDSIARDLEYDYYYSDNGHLFRNM